MEKIRLGIVGLGRMGYQHAQNIHYRIPDAEIAAACSVVPEELTRVAAEMRPGLVTDTYAELLADESLDGIVIATASQTHREMICQAAEAGKRYVFTEKPIGMNVAEIEAIRKTVAAHPQMRLQVGFNRRFDPSIQTARRQVAEGAIGRPIQIRMVNRDPAAMADFIIKFSPLSGGLIMDMLTHDYDLARWIIGSEANSVYGLGDAFVYEGLVAVGDIDNCNLLVEFKNGVIGQFETSRNCAYGYHVEMEIYGSQGCIRVGDAPDRDRVTLMNKDGVHKQHARWFFEYWEPTFLAEFEAFVACIRENGEPPVGLMDGYKAVAWAHAATQAVRDRRIVSV
jgi:myo-inositol 2-dehydrogenase / D-chiro-inositol 1-dehydrogenase